MTIKYKLIEVSDERFASHRPNGVSRRASSVPKHSHAQPLVRKRKRDLAQVKVRKIGQYVCVFFADDQWIQQNRGAVTGRTAIGTVTQMDEIGLHPIQPSPTRPRIAALRSGWAVNLANRSRFDPEAAERHYQALGRWKGPLAAPEVQAAAHDFWLGAGEVGAIWLARRLREETNVEALHGAGSQLAGMGEVALGPILDELDRQPAVDQAIALLKAIGWMIEATPTLRSSVAATEATLGRLLQSREADIREGAAEALRLLPADRAAVWLESRLGDEECEDVILTIREVLGRLRAGG